MMMWKIPVRGVLEGIEGVNLDSFDHEADVVRLPIQVKVYDVDDDQDGADGVFNTYRSVDAVDGLDMPSHHLKWQN